MICYDEKNQVFHLQTPHSSYVMGVLRNKFLLHLHWGGKLGGLKPAEDMLLLMSRAFSPTNYDQTDEITTDALPMEYPAFGNVDLRSPAFHGIYEDGSHLTELRYQSYRIFAGKPQLQGLPATYVEKDEEAQTLEITLADEQKGIHVILSYTVFEGLDAIAKNVRVENRGKETVHLERALSSCIDFQEKDFDLLHLQGAWARERHIQKVPVGNCLQMVDSKRGASGHMRNPFFALTGKHTTETQGDAYGFSLVYSGNFAAGAETDQYDSTRAFIGINPFGFYWKLSPGETFQTPEAVLVYSSQGLGEMSRTYHQLYRTRLCRGKYRDAERPVLLNNWEATYFDFDEQKILNIAAKAKEAGVELMVLDDGWFGKRNADNCSLGDWTVNREKLPGGIDGLARKVEDMGMRFGLWFEPEMVSKDSDLFRAHPDWYLHTEGRPASESRHQFILDLSRKEVCDYVVDAVNNILQNAQVSYVKWDMNRNMSEVGSAALPADRQGEVYHRYILGLYDIMGRITKANPDVLFESCSGGGGRFDPGILYYMPQTWTSDDSDAIERLFIQHGTSVVYPASAMGAHVSAVPNHQVGRTTPLSVRGHVAMAGQFGYELDLAKLTEEELEEVKEQIKTYKKIRKVVHQGKMYRLKSPFEGNQTAWEFVSEDGKTAVLFTYTIKGTPSSPVETIRLQGLEADAVYREEESGVSYDGSYLMAYGLKKFPRNDYESKLYIFQKQE